MFKVLTIVDKPGTALDRLSQGVKPYMDGFQYDVLAVHPKRPDNLPDFEMLASEADVIDYQYFRTAEMLREKFPWLKDKPSILTHNNAYSHREGNWNDYQIVVGNNKTIYEELGKITQSRVELIPLTVDTDFWTFKREWKPKRQVIMVANRIESKKGILPVAQACQKLEIDFVLVGAVSDAEYFHQILRTGVKFHQEITDEQLRDLYYESMVHVCNSIDDFESGTLPVLEAMLCGVPVISRRVGHVPDLYKDNMVINESTPDDVDNLVKLIGELVDDRERQQVIRNKAWDSAKVRSNERRAVMYQRLYRQLIPGTPVSVIVPIANKAEVTEKCLDAIDAQDYPNLEIVIVDDGLPYENTEVVMKFKDKTKHIVKYLTSYEDDYGLARARNMGIIYSTGDILVFCDQRMIMEPDCVSKFIERSKPRVWLYGNKGVRKEFVENLSCVYRQDVIDAGMFMERVNEYGGMSQEVRDRIRTQGMQTEFVEDAKAEPMGKSTNRMAKKDSVIRMKNLLWRIGRV